MSVRDTYADNNLCYKAQIELCTTCNWDCLHCYLPKHNNRGLDTKKLLQLFTELRELGVYDLEFTGGEIFTRSDCLLLVEEARRMGFCLYLLSNVSLLTEEKIKRLAELQIEGIDCTIFSMNDTVHDSFVQKEGALKAALANILLLKANRVKVKVKCILTNRNWDAYKDIMSFCKKHQLEYLFTPSVYSRIDGDSTPLDLRVSGKALEQIIRDTTENEGYRYQGQTKEDYICNSARYGMFIDSTGGVHPCSNHPWIIGNISDRSLADIWQDKRYSYIKNLKYKDTDKCGSCSLLERCFTCSGINELNGYSLLGADKQDCQLARLRLKYFS